MTLSWLGVWTRSSLEVPFNLRNPGLWNSVWIIKTCSDKSFIFKEDLTNAVWGWRWLFVLISHSGWMSLAKFCLIPLQFLQRLVSFSLGFSLKILLVRKKCHIWWALIVCYKKYSRRKRGRTKQAVWNKSSIFKVVFNQLLPNWCFRFSWRRVWKDVLSMKTMYIYVWCHSWCYFSKGNAWNLSCNICWHSQICCLSSVLAFEGHEVHLYPDLFWNCVIWVLRKSPCFSGLWYHCSEYTWRETAKSAR